MDRINKTVANLNLKDLSDAPPSYDEQSGKLIAVNDTETGIKYAHINEFMEEAGINTELNMLTGRLESIEQKTSELLLENDILLNRESVNSQFIIDLLLNENVSNTDRNTSFNPAELMIDNDWNDNWKFDEANQMFKQGYMRPRKQPYMLEVIDEYNLIGIGQGLKANISQYDLVNDCYWMITNTGQNTVGEIVKLSSELKNNKCIILSRWYLDAAGAGKAWTLIQVNGAGSVLYFGYYLSGTGSDGSKIYSIPINTDGSLGVVGYKKYNGETINTTLSISLSKTDNTASSFIMGIVDWSSTEIAYLLNATTTVTLKFLLKSDFSAGSTSITGFGNYVGGSTSYNRSMCKNGNDLYIKINDATDSKRFIYKFNINNDIISNAVIKASGKFDIARNVSENAESGITISKHGDLLEVISTTSNGTFIARHALRDALWAESLICEEQLTTTYGTNDSRLLYIDDTYIYYSTNNTNANLARLYRRKKSDNTENYSTFTVAGWTHIEAMVIASVGGTEYMFFLGNNNAGTCYSRAVPKSIIDARFDGGDLSTDISTVGLAFTGYEAAKNQLGITTDGTYLYIICDTDDAIDRWTLAYPPVKDTDNYITILAAQTDWRGIAYSNNKFYISDYYSSGISRIYALKSTPVAGLASGKTGFLLHQYQDPSNVTGSLQCIMYNNMLYRMQYNNRTIRAIKTLEDPDVMQVQTMNLCSHNILLSDHTSCCTEIAERYFEPDEFSDIRNVPDKYYMAVGYRDEGMSILHLDAFLSGTSSTGKRRYDISKIRTWHYKRGTAYTTAWSSMYSLLATNALCLHIEKDMIFAAKDRSDDICNMVMVDLKAGKVYNMGTYNNVANGSGTYSTDPLNDRNNEPFGATAITNPELMLSLGASANTGRQVTKVRAATFYKEDITDYNFQYPKTYVAISTTGGCDVLVIDWDENNNRTPTKVWNNIGNDVVQGQFAAWIAPSGYFFTGQWNTTGNIIASTVPIWEIATDTFWADTSKYKVVTQLGNYPLDISINSLCWKTPSGQWRHKLLCSTYTASSAPLRIALIDVENSTMELIHNVTASAYYFWAVAAYEDRMFSKSSYTSTTEFINGSVWHKKRKIDFNASTELSGTWDFFNYVANTTRPYLTHPTTNSGSTRYYVNTYERYSKDFNMLATASYGWGLQFFFFPQINNCEYISKEFTIDDPSEIIYKQSNIIPMANETV